MIERLRIQNFQSHEGNSLEFAPGVNVIIGASDTGKSAIIRSLKWIAWNRPLGNAFRSYWDGVTKAELEFSDGIQVSREKDSNEFYLLQGLEAEEDLEFTAFGTSVPEEVEEALNLSELNFQGQMDSAFLISNNPGEVSRHFNKVANIEQIDTSLKNVESRIRSLKQDKVASEEEIVRLEEDLGSYGELDKMVAELEVLEEMQKGQKGKENQVRGLEKICNQITSVSDQIKELSDILLLEKKVDVLLRLVDKKGQREKQLKIVERILSKIEGLDKQVLHFEEILQSEDLINQVLELYNKKSEFEDQFERLEKIIDSEQRLMEDLLEAECNLEDLENKWIQNMPDICPLCDQELPIF